MFFFQNSFLCFVLLAFSISSSKGRALTDIPSRNEINLQPSKNPNSQEANIELTAKILQYLNAFPLHNFAPLSANKTEGKEKQSEKQSEKHSEKQSGKSFSIPTSSDSRQLQLTTQPLQLESAVITLGQLLAIARSRNEGVVLSEILERLRALRRAIALFPAFQDTLRLQRLLRINLFALLRRPNSVSSNALSILPEESPAPFVWNELLTRANEAGKNTQTAASETPQGSLALHEINIPLDVSDPFAALIAVFFPDGDLQEQPLNGRTE